MTMLTQQSIASVPTPPPGHLSYQVFQQWGIDVMKGVGGPGRVFLSLLNLIFFHHFWQGKPILLEECRFSKSYKTKFWYLKTTELSKMLLSWRQNTLVLGNLSYPVCHLGEVQKWLDESQQILASYLHMGRVFNRPDTHLFSAI